MNERIHLDDLASDQLEALHARAETAEAERDGAYRERNALVALLAGYSDGAVVAPATDVDEPGWQIVYLYLARAQMSWHVGPRDADLVEHIEHVPADDPCAQWDGHTTEQKYEQIAAHAATLAKRCGPSRVEVHVQPGPPHVRETIRDIRRHGVPPNRRP